MKKNTHFPRKSRCFIDIKGFFHFINQVHEALFRIRIKYNWRTVLNSESSLSPTFKRQFKVLKSILKYQITASKFQINTNVSASECMCI